MTSTKQIKGIVAINQLINYEYQKNNHANEYVQVMVKINIHKNNDEI